MYQYKHQNGNIINKPDFVVNSIGAFDYFDSPYVITWWHINDKTRECDRNIEDWLRYGIQLYNEKQILSEKEK